MYIEAKMKEEIQTLSALYLGSPNRALVMIEKGAPVSVEDEDGKPAQLLDKNGEALMMKNRKGESVAVSYTRLKRYSPEEMLDKLRELDKKAKELQAQKEAFEKAKEATGSAT